MPALKALSGEGDEIRTVTREEAGAGAASADASAGDSDADADANIMEGGQDGLVEQQPDTEQKSAPFKVRHGKSIVTVPGRGQIIALVYLSA